jgi:hypothetical protein
LLFQQASGKQNESFSLLTCDASFQIMTFFAFLCAFAPLRETFRQLSRKGAKAQRIAKNARTGDFQVHARRGEWL